MHASLCYFSCVSSLSFVSLIYTLPSLVRAVAIGTAATAMAVPVFGPIEGRLCSARDQINSAMPVPWCSAIASSSFLTRTNHTPLDTQRMNIIITHAHPIFLQQFISYVVSYT